MKIGLYKTFDIEHTATKEEIKKAFYKLAHIHHPDKGGNEKTFKEYNAIYQVLINDEKRAAYDFKLFSILRPQQRDTLYGFEIVITRHHPGYSTRAGFDPSGTSFGVWTS